MALTSFSFLCFASVAMILYYLVPGKFQWGILLGISVFYYSAAGKPFMLLFLGTSILTTWFGAKLIDRSYDKSQNKSESFHNKQQVKRFGLQSHNWILFMILAVNIGFLAAFKYLNFFLINARIITGIFSLNFEIPNIGWLSPLGISFYTLQITGYVLDVYRKTIKPEKNLFKYALFACFFPQMNLGPISRYNELAPQLYSPKKFDYTKISFGIQRVLWGFFKKLVISERMAVIVNTVYTDYQHYSGLYIVFATICYGFQLYTDFSGAMDIVLGIAQVFGIVLPENFSTPFFSKSVSEFWRRWHITLGSWLKEYIFYPLMKTDIFLIFGENCKARLGKKRGKKIPAYAALFVIWFSVGLWHGGSYKYILGTGIYYWSVIVGGELLKPVFDRGIKALHIRTDCFSYKIFQVMRTFFLMCISFVFFRAESLKKGIDMLKLSLHPNWFTLTDGSLLRLGLDTPDFTVAIIALSILLLVSALQQKYQIREAIASQNLVFRWMIYFGLIFSVILFGFYGPGYDSGDFIYQAF